MKIMGTCPIDHKAVREVGLIDIPCPDKFLTVADMIHIGVGRLAGANVELRKRQGVFFTWKRAEILLPIPPADRILRDTAFRGVPK